MNEQVQKELAAWLGSIRDGAGQAKDFVLEQAPLVVREMVVLGRAEMTAVMLLGAILLVGGAVVFHRCLRRWRDKDAPNTESLDGAVLIIVQVAAVVATIAGPIVLLAEAHWFLAVWFAPRVYIVETLARLVGVAQGKS
jgi:hypothetical protein